MVRKTEDGSCKWCNDIKRRDECEASFFVDLWLAEIHVPGVRLCYWSEERQGCETQTDSLRCE